MNRSREQANLSKAKDINNYEEQKLQKALAEVKVRMNRSRNKSSMYAYDISKMLTTK
jgi:hypothetical protein